MKSVRLAILLCSAGAVILPTLVAQPGKGAGRPARPYDPAAEATVTGTILTKGDAIEILGARTTIGAQQAIIAREVTKDGKKLILRDATGRPRWAGPPRRVTG
ncbi:MAG: hypothetical protein LAP40_10960 [Acidobacteriia bacterium]|nr:hypothetical protein [Terriglobia bacterium]